ncbi:MAG: hypothetical protein R2795_01585 [Saprospiraceae bacterium]
MAAPENLYAEFLLHYEWMPAAKSFVLLFLRDTALECQKAHLLWLDNRMTNASYEKWHQSAHATLVQASSELSDYYDTLLAAYPAQNRTTQQQLDRWKHQDLPWPVYKEQFIMVGQQIAGIEKQAAFLLDKRPLIQQIEQLITINISDCEQELKSLNTIAQQGLAFDGATDVAIPFVEELENSIPQTQYGVSCNQEVEQAVKRLPGDISIMIGSKAGQLTTKELNLQKFINRWLDAEVFPLLYEIWELTINIRNNLKMALVNIRNRAVILSGENKSNASEGNALFLPLANFQQQLQLLQQELSNLQSTLRERMEGNFCLSNLYQKEELFLSVPFSSNITQFRKSQNALGTLIANWWKVGQQTVEKGLAKLRAEDALGHAEKISRHIYQRTPRAHNHPYTSIFLTKGYVGESFWVGRQQEMERMDTLITRWLDGYRGAALLTGPRLCGKSLFGDVVSNRYFPTSTLQLHPNSHFHWKGKRYYCGYNLKDALEVIARHSTDQKPLVWIDDLELWHDHQYNISLNVATLQHYIDRYANRIFFMVAVGNPLATLLETTHQFSHAFQAVVPLDTMPFEAIRQAVSIRHGATHKVMVQGEENMAVGPGEFNAFVQQVFRQSAANIGETLNNWAVSVEMTDEQLMRFVPLGRQVMTDFPDAAMALILRILVLEKRTTEYRLRKRFGPAYNPTYSQALLRLMGMKVVERHIDNWLELNETVANEVTHWLVTKNTCMQTEHPLLYFWQDFAPSWMGLGVLLLQLILLYLLLQGGGYLLERIHWHHHWRQRLLKWLHNALLLFEPAAILWLTSYFVWINPLWHGLAVGLLILTNHHHIRNYFSGQIIRFDADIEVGSRLSGNGHSGIITRIRRLRLRLQSEEGLHLLEYTSMLQNGFTILTGDTDGGFFSPVCKTLAW